MPVLRNRPRGALALPVLLLCLASCSSVLTEGTSVGAGVAAAGLASAVTKNGTVTAAIGIGVQSAASSGLHYVERRVHRVEQQAIASLAGGLPVGAVGHWAVSHDIPIEADEHGQVSVSRDFGIGAMQCREIVFSVDQTVKDGVQQAFYVTDICRDGDTWQWASAEPATARWGVLQ